MQFDQLPSLSLSRIAHYLSIETPFRDKDDIACEALNLSLVAKQFKELSEEILHCIDPACKNGQLSPVVLKNIQKLRTRWISLPTANMWGLQLSDLEHIPYKEISGNKHYKLQQVKRLSEQKFCGSVQQLKSCRQFQRYKVLENALTEHGVKLRIDSKFCDRFIKTGQGDPNNIAKLLKEMEFYHIFTDYFRFFSACAAKYTCEYGYYDRNHISIDAKKQALQDFIHRNPHQLHLIPTSLHRFISH